MAINKKRTIDRRSFLKIAGLTAGIVATGNLTAACGGRAQPAPTAVPAKPTSASAQSAPTVQAVTAATQAPATPAWAPKSEITFLVPFSPGGTNDPIARALAQASEPILKQKFVVVNKPGANGTLGISEVVQSKPDGYKIGIASQTITTFEPQFMSLPFNSPQDYQPLVKITELPVILCVRPDAPWKTLKDFLDDAKKRPGEIRYGSSGRYAAMDLPMQELLMVAKADVTSVPFTGGGGEAITAVLGGHVEAVVSSPLSLAPQVQAGTLKALTVIHKDRSSLFPNTPTVVEAGYNVSHPVMYFAIAPKGMDASIVGTYRSALADAIKSPSFQQFAKENGFVTEPLTPEELTKELDEWYKNYERLIRELKIEVKK